MLFAILLPCILFRNGRWWGGGGGGGGGGVAMMGQNPLVKSYCRLQIHSLKSLPVLTAYKPLSLAIPVNIIIYFHFSDYSKHQTCFIFHALE